MYKLLRIISFLSIFVPTCALLAMDHSEDEKEEAAEQKEREYTPEQMVLNEELFNITKSFTPVEGKHISIFIKAIEQKADVDVQNEFGVTPLIQASISGHREIAALLLKAGANANCKTYRDGNTALICAANQFNMVSLLIENGARVDERNLKGNTALMEAALNSYEDSIVRLVCAGADVNIKNGNGKTVFDLMRERGADKNTVFVNALVNVLIKKERVSPELYTLAHMLHDQVIETTPQLVDELLEIIVDYMVPYFDIDSPYRLLNRFFIEQEWIKIKDTLKKERTKKEKVGFLRRD